MRTIAKKTSNLFQKIALILAPPPKLTVSEWADTYRVLSRETSASPGKWKTDTAPYQREIMDSVTDSLIEKIIVKASSQVGKTEIELNIVGYFMHYDPCPIMCVLPNKKPVAEDWSRDRIAPMIRDTEVLAEKVSDPKSRDGDNATLHKSFPGGILVLAGANSPSDLASRPIRIILGDEIDRFPDSAASEGDPKSLAEKRTITFWNRKIIYVSTPTVKGQSAIDAEYEKGTMEEWRVKCPCCLEPVFITINGIQYKHVWITQSTVEVSNVTFTCPHCDGEFDEQTWKSQKGVWVAQNPDVKKIRSFSLNAFVSPWYPWASIVKEYVEAKNDPTKLSVVYNTLFGESFEEKGEIENEDFLLDRREEYPAELQKGVLMLTCGVDVQDDRLEYEIVGWGKGEESWGIEYGVIIGKPDKASTWESLTGILEKTRLFDDQKGLGIACTCIDSGGHYTEHVYKYCKKNEHRRVVAIKGMGGPGIPLIYKMSKTKKERALLVILGVDTGKSEVMNSLKTRELGEKYCHFPLDEARGYDRIYFKGIISEKKVYKKHKGGYRATWEKTSHNARNEPFDLRNYNLAALRLVNPNFERLERLLKEADSAETGKVQPSPSVKKRGCVKKGIDF